MKIYPLLLFCFISSLLKAQPYPQYFGPNIDFRSGDTVYTLQEQNDLKQKPTATATTMAVLGIAEQLIIDTTYREPYEAGYSKPLFYKVYYNGKRAYIHRNNIAMKGVEDPSTKLMLLFNLIENKDRNNTLLIKEVNNSTQKAREFKLPLFGDVFSVSLTDTKGLTVIRGLIIVDYLAEACGVDGGKTYYSWSTDSIRYIAHVSQVVDGGEYSLEEALVFPADSCGKAGAILFKSDSYELVEEETHWYRNIKTEKTYKWVNGRMEPAFNKRLIEE